jgi:hypothetical protein
MPPMSSSALATLATSGPESELTADENEDKDKDEHKNQQDVVSPPTTTGLMLQAASSSNLGGSQFV